MSEPDLKPGETVLLNAHPDPSHLRGRWLVMVGIFAVLFLLVTTVVDGLSRGGWLLAVAFYAAGTAVLVMGIEARRRWTLTNRRVIAPNGAALDLPVRLETGWRGLTAVDLGGQRLLLRDMARDGALARALRGET